MSILRIPPKRGVETGIRYEGLLPGLVAEIEERDAAKNCGVSWVDYRDMEYVEQVKLIAYYRVSRIVDMHKDEAVNDASERKSRLAQMKTKR